MSNSGFNWNDGADDYQSSVACSVSILRLRHLALSHLSHSVSLHVLLLVDQPLFQSPILFSGGGSRLTPSVGIPMVLFYHPPELPFHNKRNGSSESTIVRTEVDPGSGALGDNISGNGHDHHHKK